MNALTLKIIAIATMLVDHIGLVIPTAVGFPPEGINLYRVIGRVAFPLFIYLIAEGFRHTKNPLHFLTRLGAFAIISEIPFDLAMNENINFFRDTNIFYTLFLGGAGIFAYQKILELKNSRVLAFLPTLALMLLGWLLSVDYGAYGVLFVVTMYVISNFKWRLVAMVALCLWQHHVLIEFIIRGYLPYFRSPVLYLLLIPATLIPVGLIAFYNGKRGFDKFSVLHFKREFSLKWLFYVFYPVHLLILVMLDTPTTLY
jgi:hypothetical protein